MNSRPRSAHPALQGLTLLALSACTIELPGGLFPDGTTPPFPADGGDEMEPDEQDLPTTSTGDAPPDPGTSEDPVDTLDSTGAPPDDTTGSPPEMPDPSTSTTSTTSTTDELPCSTTDDGTATGAPEDPSTGGGSVCGDGEVDADEICDDGLNDGSYGGCMPSCHEPAPTCGDGVVNGAPETCDDGNVIDDDDCTNQCTRAACGDGVLQPWEQCESLVSTGTPGCEALGFAGGVLVCTPESCSFDVTGCVGCGNGIVEKGELCDSDLIDVEACIAGQTGGAAVVCNATCDGFDPLPCSRCGDGVINDFEACDGTELGGQDCVAQGFGGGALGCSPRCERFDTSACESPEGDCCDVGGAGACSIAAVSACVCALDGDCCEGVWDEVCVAIAVITCDAACG